MQTARPSCLVFKDTATTEIAALSRRDALPSSRREREVDLVEADRDEPVVALLVQHEPRVDDALAAIDTLDDLLGAGHLRDADRKSTRLNSSHANISYAVFCLTEKAHMTAA